MGTLLYIKLCEESEKSCNEPCPFEIGVCRILYILVRTSIVATLMNMKLILI